ncbi:MAG: AsmA-like C-terminal region-containing protein [Hyphomicrobium sp.]|jgi:hypothetical protein
MRVGHWFLLFGGPVILLSVIAAIVVYVRLLHGPISLKSFAGSIENSINAELDEVKAKIDDAVLTLSDGSRIELRLINLRFNKPNGDLVASAPLAAVEPSTRALWQMRLAPERVFLIEPRLSLFYTEQTGLVMSFDDPAPSPDKPAPGAASDQGSQTTAVTKDRPGQGTSGAALPATFLRVDLARTLAESSRRARRREDASSEIKEIGLRNATVVMHYAGSVSELSVEQAALSLDHRKKRSVISGSATFQSAQGPWFMTFRSEDSEKGNFLKVSTSVKGLVPSTLAKASPQLSLLAPLEMPVSGEMDVELSTEGDLRGASLTVDVGRGRINLPSLASAPLILDSGRVRVECDGGGRGIRVLPSTFKWGDSHVTLEGSMTSEQGGNGLREWAYLLKSSEGKIVAEEFGVAAIALDQLEAKGRIIPSEGLVKLAKFTLKAGGSEITANGDLVTGSGVPSTRVEAAMSPMTLPTLKALWPRAVVPSARAWIGTHITQANLRSASLKLLSGSFLPEANGIQQGLGAHPSGRLSMSIEVGDLRMLPYDKGLPIDAPRALIRLENDALEVTVPEAAVVAGQKQVPLKGGRFTIVSLENEVPIGELAFRAQAPLAAVAEAMALSGIGLNGTQPLPIEGLDGKVEGQFKLTMPISERDVSAVPKIEGKARVTEIRGKHKGAKVEIQGGSVDMDLSPTGVLVMGELIVNGVVAKVNLQRIFDASPELQPPFRITAKLDNADRTQLGLDINHLVQGEIALELTAAKSEQEAMAIHARADLTNAELIFDDLAWRKSPGRAAGAEFDVAIVSPDLLELRNFRIVGDTVAIEGSLSIDANHVVQEFSFPNFSLNVVSRLDVQGKLGSDKIWKIKAKGSTFDAKDLFRSLLSLGKTAEAEIKPLRPAAGVDLSAEVDTVLGHSDISMRGVKVKLSERADQLVALDVQGALDGGKPVAVLMKAEAGRKIFAESQDAGQAFKLVGFYPNLQGGRMRLEVDLAGRGAAEKTGILWVDDFRVLGDPVLQDLYSTVETTGPGIDAPSQGQRRVTREVFDFSRMKVPFSVGHGQFVLDESYVRGPLLGASIRGKVDYTTERLTLGGTYVPLQGINSAFCDIPLVGPLVSGLDCQGVFGITYAIEGPMTGPQVFVNPLSVFTPGILRGIMELTSPNPEVQPRSNKPKGPVEQRVRASSSAASAGQAGGAQKPATPGSANPAAHVDGWSLGTTTGAAPATPAAAKPQPAKKKKAAAPAKPAAPTAITP